MKTHRRLNKAGKIALFSILTFIFIIIILIMFIQHRNKNDVHILKTGKNYQIDIHFPVFHDKKIDHKIKEYVMEKKNEFINKMKEIENLETNTKNELVIQYQQNKKHDIYHIRLETYSHIGENHDIKENETLHYHSKKHEFLSMEEYLKDTSSLEQLSLLSYYYVMEYGEKTGKEFDENIIKEYTSRVVSNFVHFDIKEEGFEFLFPFYKNPLWKDGEVKIIIPYQELNSLLKPEYQKKISNDTVFLTPEKRNLDQYKQKKLIAFTFDDGPSTKTTGNLLEGLKQFDAKVTFFVLGNRLEQNKEILKRAYQEGHDIGSHTYNHRNLLLLNDYDRLKEIKKTNQQVEEIIGMKPTLLRPPYGNINNDIKKIVNMHIIEWGIDPLDWKYKDKDYIANEIIEHAYDGAIVLLHDIYDASVEGALEAMRALEQMGYAFVTISEMAELKNITLDYMTAYRNF